MSEEQLQRCLELIEAELRSPTKLSSKVLFGDEFGASDWTEEDAVRCLFRYASYYGWGEE